MSLSKHQGWHIGIGRYSPYRQNLYIGIGNHSCWYIDYAWVLYKARISADAISPYIGYDKSISAYRLSVKFHRYANPGEHSFEGVPASLYNLTISVPDPYHINIEVCYRVPISQSVGWNQPHERSNLIIFEISVNLLRKYFAYMGVGVILSCQGLCGNPIGVPYMGWPYFIPIIKRSQNRPKCPNKLKGIPRGLNG